MTTINNPCLFQSSSEANRLRIPIILASQSPNRLALLKRIKIFPDQILPADIDESEKKKELPGQLVTRLAHEKATKISDTFDEALIIAADTVVAIGRMILPKALTADEVRECLKALSHRRHRVYTGVCIIKKSDGQLYIRQKLVQTIVKFKKLTTKDIDFYSNLGEGLNKAGGYSILEIAESFVTFISGSYSNVVGLPLSETANMLNSLGVKIGREQSCT
jgi:septum formation protein